MILNTTKTVRELAVELPHATRIFEKLKIDYCCGGHRPLAEACAQAGMEPEEVARLLTDAEQALAAGDGLADYQAMPLAELAGFIVTKHHTFARQEAERLMALLDKVCSAHGENHPELLEIKSVFQTLRVELEQHMFKEERMLFPYIAQMEGAFLDDRPAPQPPFGTVRNPVAVMSREHDAAGELLRDIREASTNFAAPDGACISYRTLYGALEAFEADLHQHIHLENNILFPRALEIEQKMLPAQPVIIAQSSKDGCTARA